MASQYVRQILASDKYQEPKGHAPYDIGVAALGVPSGTIGMT